MTGMGPLGAVGELSVEVTSTGKFRWVYISAAGAMHIGPKLYKTRAAARKAGSLWLEQREGS